MKRLKFVVILVSICTVFAYSIKQTKTESNKIYAGITYGMAKKGASDELTLGVGVVGVVHAAAEGAIYGAVFGNLAGAVAGAVVGL